MHKRGPLGFILSGRLRSHVSVFSTTLPMVPSESLPRSTRPHWLRSPGARAPGSGGGRPAPCLASAAVQRRESTALATGSNCGARWHSVPACRGGPLDFRSILQSLSSIEQSLQVQCIIQHGATVWPSRNPRVGPARGPAGDSERQDHGPTATAGRSCTEKKALTSHPLGAPTSATTTTFPSSHSNPLPPPREQRGGGRKREGAGGSTRGALVRTGAVRAESGPGPAGLVICRARS